MKILFCTNAFENTTNGPAKFANLILDINRLPLNTEVRILTEDVQASTKEVYKLDIKISRWIKPLGQIVRMFYYHREAEKIYREYPFDVLIYNNAFIGLVSALKKKFPTIGMINDDNNLDATFTELFRNKYRAKRYVFRLLEKTSAKKHGLLISNSNYLTKKLISGYNLNPDKIKRLYKAIDTNKVVLKDNTSIDPQNIKILFIKNDFLRGGILILKEALQLLPEYNFQLTIAGPEHIFENKITEFFSGSNNVKLKFLGPRSQKEILNLYRENDIFCVPSLKEALGVANIEAMASGITIVSSNAGGIPEILKDGLIGWLSEPGNSISLASCLKEAITDEKLRIKKSNYGREIAKDFSSEFMFKNFVTIVHESAKKHA